MIAIAACLACIGVALPGAIEAEQLFGAGQDISEISIRQLQGTQRQIDNIAAATNSVADVTGKLSSLVNLPGVRILKPTVDAVADEAAAIHASARSLQDDIPKVIDALEQADSALEDFELRTVRAMQAARVLLWLAAVIVAGNGIATLLAAPGSQKQAA